MKRAVVYGRKFCLVCPMAVEYLKKLGYEVEFKDISKEAPPNIDPKKATVPIIVIGNTTLIGFDVEKILEADKREFG